MFATIVLCPLAEGFRLTRRVANNDITCNGNVENWYKKKKNENKINAMVILKRFMSNIFILLHHL